MRLLVLLAVVGFASVPSPLAAQCTAQSLTCGTTTTFSLGPGASCVIDTFPTKRFSFTGTAGQKVTLTARNSTGKDIGMNLTTSTGSYVSSGFDEPSQITATLPATGTYYVDVNFGTPYISGTISLEITCTTGSTTQPCAASGTLRIGQSVSGQLTAADSACGNSKTYAKGFLLQVMEGEAFSVDYSASYKASIQIAGPSSSGSSTGVWRDSPTNSLTTEYVAPTAGLVTIWALSNTTSPVTGTFTLTTSPITLPVCGRMRAVRH